MALESNGRKQRGLKRLIHSFRYAWEGFKYTLKNEQNMLVHLLVALFVIIAGWFFQISILEWLICLLFMGLVIGTELINTSIEAVVDLVSPEKNVLAKIAKDTAAGSVMVEAFFASVSGMIIFIPKIIEMFIQ